MTKPTAIITMMTSDDFLPGVQCLFYSLASKNCHNADKIVLVTDAISKPTRIQLKRIRGLAIREVEAIPNPHASTCKVEGWVNSGYTKLRVWELEEYSRAIYLDADCLVVGSLERLFSCSSGEDWNGFSAVPDVFPPDKFNAGVMVLKPNSEVFRDMMEKINLPSHDNGDTGFLNSYFSDWYSDMPPSSRLPFGLNAQRILHWFTHSREPGYWDVINPLDVVHYSSSPKPWDAKNEKKGELEILWWDYFTRGVALGGLGGF